MGKCEKVCVALVAGLLTDSGVFAFSSNANKEPSGLVEDVSRETLVCLGFSPIALPHTHAEEALLHLMVSVFASNESNPWSWYHALPAEPQEPGPNCHNPGSLCSVKVTEQWSFSLLCSSPQWGTLNFTEDFKLSLMLEEATHNITFWEVWMKCRSHLHYLKYKYCNVIFPIKNRHAPFVFLFE